jgi:hypothetical protein
VLKRKEFVIVACLSSVRRIRLGYTEARLWRRTIDRYWHCGWTLREIGDQFGVHRQNVPDLTPGAAVD